MHKLTIDPSIRDSRLTVAHDPNSPVTVDPGIRGPLVWGNRKAVGKLLRWLATVLHHGEA